MTMESVLTMRGKVPFPEFTGERIYMVPFRKRAGLSSNLRRWQPTVDAMLDGIPADLAYLMVDQGCVAAGGTLRRPGVHMDGYWLGAQGRHGHGHGGGGGHIHAQCVEAILLASDVLGCRGYSGTFEGEPLRGGNCAHIDYSGMVETVFSPGYCWAGNWAMLHEALPMRDDSRRTVVRLNVPGWTP